MGFFSDFSERKSLPVLPFFLRVTARNRSKKSDWPKTTFDFRRRVNTISASREWTGRFRLVYRVSWNDALPIGAARFALVGTAPLGRSPRAAASPVGSSRSFGYDGTKSRSPRVPGFSREQSRRPRRLSRDFSLEIPEIPVPRVAAKPFSSVCNRVRAPVVSFSITLFPLNDRKDCRERVR